MTTVSS